MTEATITDSAADTLRAAAERMWRNQTGSLLVMDDGRLTGIFAALVPGGGSVEHKFDHLVRERRLARIEHGDLD